MDNILSRSKEINLRFYKETTKLQAHEVLSSDILMPPTPLARQAISKLPAQIDAVSLRSDFLCDSSLGLSIPKHPVTSRLKIFFLSFCAALHCYEPYISGTFCMFLMLEHRCAQQIGTFDDLIHFPATFLQDRMISVLPDILHKTRSCAGVSKSMSVGGVV